MKQRIICKTLAVAVIILFIGLAIQPSVAVQPDKESSIFFNTLYVGGSGLGNYTKIQDAINDANNGDTIFVYDDSSPYYENIFIDKSVKLFGENRDTTIIDGSGKGIVISVISDAIFVKDFTIQNGSVGLHFDGHNAKKGAHTHLIKRNRIRYNNIGVKCDYSYYNTISNNIIEYNNQGIMLNNESCFNLIKKNQISDNECEGIVIRNSEFNFVKRNNLYDNNPSVYFIVEGTYSPFHTWQQSYWYALLIIFTLRFIKNYYESGSKLPYPIHGRISLYSPNNQEDYEFFHKRFDWHPAKEPYDI